MRHVGSVTLFAVGLALCALCVLPARAADPDPVPGWKQAFDNDYYKLSLNVRARIELADFDGLDRSEAYTVRTRAGIEIKPWNGLSAFGEIENSSAIQEDQYYDMVERPDGNSPIADPEDTGLNQLYLRYQNPELAGLEIKAGRQRILLDDHRFVGNVGWRQNEQTYDAALVSSSLGIDGLLLTYGYIDDVLRIFGDDGPPAQEDFESDSHLVHLTYAGWSVGKITAFGYLLDFDNSPGNSSNSYGVRLTGSRQLGSGDWSAGYAGSWARQSDAGDNPVDYAASYVALDANLGYADLGKLGLGYELLGTDDGKARFVTPLATAHKFNGFADAFLDNGGVRGLRDAYAYLAPALPWQLKGQLTYHRFYSDRGGDRLGDEVNLVLSRPVLPGMTVLTKGARFNGTSRGPADRWRFWLELSFGY